MQAELQQDKRRAQLERRLEIAELKAEIKHRKAELASKRWIPNPCRDCGGANGGCEVCQHTSQGPQGAFMETMVDVVGYGGAAGGGKSSSGAIKAALVWGKYKNFYGLLFRRTRPEAKDSLWREVKAHYKNILPKTRLVHGIMEAHFPAGGLVRASYMQNPGDEDIYQGGGYQYVLFDEATHFPEDQVRYIFTRMRSADGIPSQMALCTNPGGRGHTWYKRWFAPWLEPKFRHPALAREVRWFIDGHDGTGAAVFEWYIEGEDGEERLVRQGDEGARSITYIPALLEDNQALMKGDPSYALKLKAVDRVRYQQLRFGNWSVKPEGGGAIYEFKRSLHMQSFTRRMEAGTLFEACRLALRRGWHFSSCWDHGIKVRKEWGGILTWNDVERELWALGVYYNKKLTIPLEDAIGFRKLLDARGIPPGAVKGSRGDVGNIGKGVATQESAAGQEVARSINTALSRVRYPDGPRKGQKILGFPIHTAEKEPGSVALGVSLLNTGFGSGLIYFDESCGPLADAFEDWVLGSEFQKDGVDMFRYKARDVLQPWIHGVSRSGSTGG